MNDDMNKEAQQTPTNAVEQTKVEQKSIPQVDVTGGKSNAAVTDPDPKPIVPVTYSPPERPLMQNGYLDAVNWFAKSKNPRFGVDVGAQIVRGKPYVVSKDNYKNFSENPAFVESLSNNMVDQGASDYDYWSNYKGTDRPARMGASYSPKRPENTLFQIHPEAKFEISKAVMSKWRNDYKSYSDQIKRAYSSSNPSDVQYGAQLQATMDAMVAKQAKAFSWQTGSDIDPREMKSYYEMDEKQSALIDNMQASIASGVSPTEAAWGALKTDPMGTLKMFATNPYARGIMVDSAKNYASDNPGKAILIGGLALLGILATIRFASGMLGGGDRDE